MDEIVDNEWKCFFQKALLPIDLSRDYEDGVSYFNFSENGVDFEVTHEEQQRYLSFLSNVPNMYLKLKRWPSHKQATVILAAAAYLSQNEKNFLITNTSGTYKLLVQMFEALDNASRDYHMKVKYLEMLCSLVTHEPGLRWSLETNHWINIYDLVIECQESSEKDDSQQDKLYNTLVKFLQITAKDAPKMCVHVIKQIMHVPLQVSGKHYLKAKKEPPDLIDLRNCCDFKLSGSITCLVEVLERLLTRPTNEVFKYFMKMQVRAACDTLSTLSGDSFISLQLDRILVLTSFYEMTELFDGIKVVNHDPIALSGFLRIIERELRKNHLKTIFELYYYALKYWKNVARKMPKYFLKEKPVDIEDELMSFQVEPVVIIGEKLLGTPQTSEEELRNCYLADLLNVYSADSLQLGYEIREQLNKEPLQIEIIALKCIIKSKPMYSRKNLAVVFQSLIYALRDYIKYMKKYPDVGKFENDKELADVLLDAILVYLENFDLSWRESIGSIELGSLVYEFLIHSTRWPSNMILKGLKTFNIAISKHMCPTMALLVDYSQNCALNNLDAMFFQSCFDNNSEVRNATLTLVCTFIQKINQGFRSFKRIIEETLTRDLILNKSVNDSDGAVRATAVKCLQEMIVMDKADKKMYNGEFLEKILQLASSERDATVNKEVVSLISQIYQSERSCENDNHKIYEAMARVALNNENATVQEEAVKFWECVMTKHLEKQGMSDGNFPSVIFSKEHRKIIRLDNKEIRRRLFQTLNGMSKSGCFDVFLRVLQNDKTSKQVSSITVTIVSKLLRLLQRYEVTPEFILFNQTYPNLWSVPSNSNNQSPANLLEEDSDMQEIIDETVMEMINNNLSENMIFTGASGSTSYDNSAGKSPGHYCGEVSTVDFMDFIYRNLNYLSN